MKPFHCLGLDSPSSQLELSTCQLGSDRDPMLELPVVSQTPWERAAKNQFFLTHVLRKQEGRVFPELGAQRGQNSPVCSLFGFSKHRHMEAIWFVFLVFFFLHSPVEFGWSEMGVDWKARIADPATWKTCSSVPQQQEAPSPQALVATPRCASQDTVPWGPPPHTLATAAWPGECWSQDHECLCPDLAPSAIAGLHLPSTLLPFGLHLSPFRHRYPGWLRRKGGAESALVFVRAATGKKLRNICTHSWRCTPTHRGTEAPKFLL